MTPDLRSRSNDPELMDGNAYSYEEFAACLRQLRLINILTDGYAPTIKALETFLVTQPRRPLHILDIGFGYGDTLREIRKWADRRGQNLILTGVDVHPWCEKLAREATPAEMRIEYITRNIFEIADHERFDIIINSLFMHHLTDHQVVTLLRWMTKHARVGWFINDLHRHPIAWHFIHWATRIFRFNRLIRNDAPLSVAKGFRGSEWMQYARQAGLPIEPLVRWHWSFRYGVLYYQPALLEEREPARRPLIFAPPPSPGPESRGLQLEGGTG